MKLRAFIFSKALLFVLLMLPVLTFAQNGKVSGKVLDAANNEPLPGVNIQIEGTTQGTTTDVNGYYELTVKGPETVLIFSFIGYNPQKIQVGQKSVIDVRLSSDVTSLEEIIVIGYGTQKKVDKTGAVSHIAADELGQGVLTDPVQGIQGKIAGVLVSKKGGDPNSGFTIRIRGAAGFSSDTQPLYVIDGVPNADPTTIAPEDIESYSVLKDAASAAIYGSQGSNGVIIITTKKGSAGKGTLQLNIKVSADRVAKKLDLLSASDIRKYVDEYNLDFSDGGANTDWQDEIYRTGLTQNYNLSYSGGTENSNYFASITHSDWQGVMKGTEKKRTIGKVNLTHMALDNRLTLSGSISGSFEDNDYENYGGFNKDDIIYQAISHNPTDPVRDTTGNYYKTIRAFNYENPLAVINGVDNIRTAKSFFGTFKADMQIFKDLIGSINFGYTLDDRESSYFRPKGKIYATADNGFGRKSFDKEQQKLMEITGTYTKSIGSHNFNLMGGYSWQQTNYNGFYAQAENPQSDFIRYNNLSSFIDITSASIDSWAGESTLIGFFGRLQYNYNNKYYLAGSLRRDGSSRFGVNNKWGWFPTVSAGWNIDREGFMQNFTVINQLKLRASYGVSGNQKIGDYHSQVVFEPTGTAIDPETGQMVTTFGPAWNANPDLKWERTSEINIGLDFAALRNRISGTLEVYSKTTDDLLDAYPVPVPPNLAPTTWANSGSMRNRGIEVFLQAFAVDRGNFKWKTSINVSHFKTINTDLGGFIVTNERKNGYLSGRGLIGDLNYVTGNIEGEELGSFYLPKYMGLSSDGYFLYESTSGGVTRELTSARRYLAGSPAPDIEIGWSNTITFLKNFDLDFSFRSIIGNDVYNATRMFFDYPGLLPSLNATPEALDWKKQGRTQGPAIADIYVEDGSFVRLDYVSLSYNLTPKSGAVKNIKLSVSSNNLFIITGYSGVDPETSYEGLAFGIDQYNVYPKTRTLTVGLTATF
ncbi:MAG TPA: SusC/RagA family TonB-linked outer membrane protein [Bacteroidales bacterium]|nr:SusC/RagA family TonB-linked outer membrane protein [Bacteroidales bacterium]